VPPERVTVEEADSVVKAPVEGVVAPMEMPLRAFSHEGVVPLVVRIYPLDVD
jgi:hypothetical protein